MTNIKYKGYIGVLAVDADASVIRGHVVNTKDTITFQGKTVAEAKNAFKESVDDYLEFCKSLGEAPERPFSGQFMVRVKPEMHRDLTAVAQSKGVSVNKIVTGALKRAIRSGKASAELGSVETARTLRAKKPK